MAAADHQAPMEAVVFVASWCAPCTAMLAEIARVQADMPALAIAVVDIDAEPQRATQALAWALAHGGAARGVPMLMIYRGDAPVAARLGMGRRAVLRGWIDGILERERVEIDHG